MSMMANCLNKMVKAGEISQQKADAALAMHEGSYDLFLKKMSPADADVAATLEVGKIMMDAAKSKRLRMSTQIVANHTIKGRMDSHPHGKLAGLNGILVRDIHEEHGGLGEKINISTQTEVIRNEALTILAPLMKNYQSTHAGLVQNMEGVWNSVRELFGNDTGDAAAKEVARAFTKAREYLLARAKRAHVQISELEDWRLPQMWDTKRVRSFGADNSEFVENLYQAYAAGDIKVMTKSGQGETPHLAVLGQLQEMQKDIIAGRGNGGARMNNQLRTIRFQNFEAYERLMKKYGHGNGNMYNALIGHINSMSQEIAWAELAGPHWRENIKIRLEEARADDAMRLATGGKRGNIRRQFSPIRAVENPLHTDRMIQYLSGELSQVESEMIAGFAGGARNIMTAAKLGSASIAAVPGDSVTAFMAARHNGIPAVRLLGQMMKGMVGGSDRELASQLNLVSSSAIDSALGSKRFEDEIIGSDVGGRLAEVTIRASGLQAWTEMAKRTVSMEFMGLIGRQSNLTHNQLEPNFRRFLDRYGFTEANWNEIRAGGMMEYDGTRYFDSTSLKNRRLSDRLTGAIFDERQFAVIEPDARIKAWSQGGGKRGTIGGEGSRSIFQFKSFPMTMLTTHVARAMITGPLHERPFRVAGLAAYTMIAGAVALQASNLLSGRDPENMTDGQFWMRSMMRGGGLGLYGDLVYSLRQRGEGGFYGALAGPAPSTFVGLASDLVKSNFTGKTLAKYMKAFMPGSTLFYARAVADRMIFDQIQAMLDSNYRQSWQRQENRMRRSTGQENWYGRGEVFPSDSPNFDNAFGG